MQKFFCKKYKHLHRFIAVLCLSSLVFYDIQIVVQRSLTFAAPEQGQAIQLGTSTGGIHFSYEERDESSLPALQALQ